MWVGYSSEYYSYTPTFLYHENLYTDALTNICKVMAVY